MTVAELINHLSQYDLDDHITDVFLPSLPIGLMNVGKARIVRLSDGTAITPRSALVAQICLRSPV